MTDTAETNNEQPGQPSQPGQGSHRPARHRRSNSSNGSNARPLDFWRVVPVLPEPEPIRPAAHAAALIESLGAPPLPGRAMEHYIAAVVDRASGLATALAASAGLLAEDDSE